MSNRARLLSALVLLTGLGVLMVLALRNQQPPSTGQAPGPSSNAYNIRIP